MHADPSTRKGPGARPRRRLQAAALAAVAASAVAIVCGGTSALAASRPSVSTGAAADVGYASAVLRGSLNPNASDTSYYFQYGLTKAYTSQTAIANAGAGTKSIPVASAIAGLAPLTVYHYRLVAVNAGGVSMGGDHNFKTTKVPLSLAILSSPNPVLVGGAVTVQGTLSGTENADRKVVLEALAWPFTASFAQLTSVYSELTTPAGGFTFTVPGLGGATQFRVVTATNPPVISPVATESVLVRVTSHVARARRRGFVRFYGTVTPAENGAQIGILRIVRGRGVLVGGTILSPGPSAGSSRYSRVVRAHRGIYRVLARVVGQPVSSNYGQPLRIR
jgi:hypothetical protein